MAETKTYNGHVYTRNAPGEPWVLSGPAQGAEGGGRQATIVSNPFRAKEEARKDSSENRDAARDNAELPWIAPKAAADVAKAQADARSAQIAADEAAKKQAASSNPEMARVQGALQTDNVLNLLNTARTQIGKGWATGNVAGTKGFQGIPFVGQNSTNLSGTLEGIQGNVINDTLKQLKALSPTGASGYGSLTEQEAARLAAAVASLKQAQDTPTLLSAIARVERHYRNALALLNNEDPRDPAVAEKYGVIPEDGDKAAGATGAAGGGAGAPGGDDPKTLTSEGKFASDPGLAGANAAVRKMIQRGASAGDVRAYLNRIRPGYGDVVQGVDEAVNYYRQHPNADSLVDIDLEKTWEPASGVSQTLGDIGMSPFGSAMIGAGDMASLGMLDNLTDNPEQARAVMGGVQELNPKSYLAGQVLGGVSTGLGAESLLARGGVSGARAALGADALYGAGYGAGSADGPNDSRVAQALIGAGAGAAGNKAGSYAAGLGGRALAGIQDGSRRALDAAGIRMTPGQVVGGAAKSVEDRLAGLPFVGDAINARRREGVQDFNRAAFDEALAPINGSTGGTIGPQGIDMARQARSDAYSAALDPVRVQADQPFEQDMIATILAGRALPDPMRGNIEYTLPTRIGNSFDDTGGLTGRDYQQSLRGLRRDAKAVESQPFGWDFGQVTNQAEGALEGLLARQSPETVPALRAANTANMNVETLRSAVNAARNGGRSGEVGVFMPSQLSDAAAASARRFGNNAGTTNQPFFDLTRAGQEVLPSQIPDSGTAGRLLLPLAAGGAIGGTSYAAQGGEADAAPSSLTTAAIIAGLLAVPYSQGARSAVQRGLLSERPRQVRDIGELLLENREIAGRLAAPGAIMYASDR